MTTNSVPIHADPVITKLLDKVPQDMRTSFSMEQLLALKVALGGRTWGAHAVDARFTLKWWRWQYYFVFLAGRNRRVLGDDPRTLAPVYLRLLPTIRVVAPDTRLRAAVCHGQLWPAWHRRFCG